MNNSMSWMERRAWQLGEQAALNWLALSHHESGDDSDPPPSLSSWMTSLEKHMYRVAYAHTILQGAEE